MSAERRTLPNLLILGAQKSATTWLADALRAHPDVFVAAGEPQYFNRDLIGFEEYAQLFRDAGHYPIRAEKTPDYLHMPDRRIRDLHHKLGDVKLMVVLRRPQDRAWSHARMEVSGFNGKPLTESDYPRLAHHVVSRRNEVRTTYADHLKRWLKVFGKQQLYVGFYENLAANPAAFIKDVVNWLEVREPTDKLPLPIWESPAIRMPSEIKAYLDCRYGKEGENLRQLGYAPPESWQDCSPAGGSMPLVGERIAMMPTNLAYGLYDMIRAKLPGRYTTTVNRVYMHGARNGWWV